MAKHGKAYTEAKNRFDREREYEPAEAIALVKQVLNHRNPPSRIGGKPG